LIISIYFTEDPKLFKKTQDQKVLDQMFGIEETKPPEETGIYKVQIKT